MARDIAYHNPDTHIVEGDEGFEELDDSEFDVLEFLDVLRSYANDAENARTGGFNPRDTIWKANWDRYWGRYDQTGKAAWQSKHVMPESPIFVDRWAASMREALDRQAEWFTVVDSSGNPSQLTIHITKTMKVLLARCARTPDGQVVDFSSVFEDQMKLGALMACCAAVTWAEDLDTEDGWPRVDTVDPREYYADPKGRNLFRKRQYEIDKYELLHIAREADDEDEPLYDIDVILELIAEEDQKEREHRARSTGTGSSTESNTGRTPIKMEEWYGTVIMNDGTVVASDALIVVANEKHLIRGPVDNPFLHNRDWLIFTPMISVPLSVYGRTYMEDWSDVADAFVELTNLILDGTNTSTMKAFVANPELLDDPTQLAEGISPNKIFETSEDVDNLKRFIAEIDLGTLPSEAFQVWTALKTELREGAKLSEISLGQFAPKGRTTKAEINTVKQSGSTMIRSMARTVESRFIEPVLDRVWKTALQHMDFMTIAEVIGVETASMLNERREEFIDASIMFRVRGISGIVDSQTRLQNLLTALQVIGQNEALAQKLFSEISPSKLISLLFSLFNIDENDIKPTEQERLIESLTTQAQAAAGGGQVPPGAAPPNADLAQ